jgi:4-hydroxybenzoate polyprenyltransferase
MNNVQIPHASANTKNSKSFLNVILLQALIPALCMNVYIVGLNQIHDIEIDKVILMIGASRK